MAPPWGGFERPWEGSAATPTRDKRKREAKKHRSRATQAQLQAQAVAEFFKDRIPLKARQATERMEKSIMEEGQDDADRGGRDGSGGVGC